jgi:hypothetical protein
MIRTMLAARPFRPFRLRLNDGRTYDVNHPDYLIMGPNGRHIIHYDSTNDDAGTILEPLLIASIEYIQPAPPPPRSTGGPGPGSSPTTERPDEGNDHELGGEA